MDPWKQKPRGVLRLVCRENSKVPERHKNRPPPLRLAFRVIIIFIGLATTVNRSKQVGSRQDGKTTVSYTLRLCRASVLGNSLTAQAASKLVRTHLCCECVKESSRKSAPRRRTVRRGFAEQRASLLPRRSGYTGKTKCLAGARQKAKPANLRRQWPHRVCLSASAKKSEIAKLQRTVLEKIGGDWEILSYLGSDYTKVRDGLSH